jgi:hypothetical protein
MQASAPARSSFNLADHFRRIATLVSVCGILTICAAATSFDFSNRINGQIWLVRKIELQPLIHDDLEIHAPLFSAGWSK